MKRFKSILCTTLLTLSISTAALAGDISGRSSNIAKPGDISGKTSNIVKPGDISGFTQIYEAILGLLIA